MQTSASLCSGVLGTLYFKDQIENGWKGKDACILAGLTVLHRYADPDEMKTVFILTRDIGLKGTCMSKDAENAAIAKLQTLLPEMTERKDWVRYYRSFMGRIWQL